MMLLNFPLQQTKNKHRQEFQTNSWVTHIFTNEYKVKHPHETLPLKSGKIRVCRVSYGTHNFVVYESGRQNKKTKKTKGLQTTDTHKSSKIGGGGGGLFFYRPSYKKVYIYMVACTTRERNVQDINNSLEEINICRLRMFVLRNKRFIHPFFPFSLCSWLLRVHLT